MRRHVDECKKAHNCNTIHSNVRPRQCSSQSSF